jgi:hypothetical protein
MFSANTVSGNSFVFFETFNETGFRLFKKMAFESHDGEPSVPMFLQSFPEFI